MNFFDSSEVLESLGLRRKTLVEYARAVKLMYWEQVLLIAFFARKKCKDEDGEHFRSRLKLLRLAKESESAGGGQHQELHILVCNLLDQGLSYRDLCRRMQEIVEGDPTGIKAQVATLLEVCDKERVQFAAEETPLQYSFYALEKSLTDIVTVFQSLLAIPAAEVLCENATHTVLTSKIPDLAKVDDSNAEQLIKNNLSTSIGSFEEDVLNAIDEMVVGPISDCFKLFEYKDFWELYMGFSRTRARPFRIDDPRVDNGKRVVVFDLFELRKSAAMGQASEVMEQLLTELVKNLGVDDLQKRSKGSQKTTLDRWFHHCSVLGVRKITSVPAMVAALLEYDFRHLDELPVFHSNFYGKLNTTQAAMAATRAIEKWLVPDSPGGELSYAGTPEDVQKWIEASGRTSKTPDPDIPEDRRALLAAIEVRDPAMKGWVFDSGEEENIDEKVLEKRMKDRFKRPRAKIEQEIDGVEEMLQRQIDKGVKTPFPVQSAYPYPLWSQDRLQF